MEGITGDLICTYAYYKMNGMAKTNAKTIKALQDQSPLSDLYSRPGFLVRRANQILMGFAEQECAKIGLTPPQHVCLSALHRCDTLDQISLGKALGMDRATVGQMLRRLEARGLVRRTISTEDSRRKIVTLTPAGKKMVAPANAAAEQVSERLLTALTPNERKKLVSLLTKVIGALNDESSTPVDPPPL